MIATRGYAVRDSKSKLAQWQFERREPGAKDVLIEILYCGICHSDIHQVGDEWEGSIYPMVPGHEIIGRIKKAGDKVKKFKVGDLAGVGCMVDSCRVCDNCKRGLEQHCRVKTVWTYNSYGMDGVTPAYGGYSDNIVVDEDFVIHISEKLPTEKTAPLLCAGITTYSPLRHWKVGKGHKLGVLGLGGLGHMAVKISAALGAEVTILSTSPKKKADAKRLGAHNFILTTDKEQARKMKNHFDYILNTVSVPLDFNMFLNMINTDGIMICVGLPTEPIKFNTFGITGNRRSVAGSVIGGIPETQEVLDFCAEQGITPDVEVIPIDYINEAYERMIRSDVRYRFVIDMSTLK